MSGKLLTEKLCKRCAKVKPRAEFYFKKNSGSIDQFCKGCTYLVRNERAQRRNHDLIAPKVCSLCKVEKARDDFYESPLGKQGLSARCKRCHPFKRASRKGTQSPEAAQANREKARAWRESENNRARSKQWFQDNREYLNARRNARYRERPDDENHEKHLEQKFKINRKQYNDMLAAQGGGCAICGSKQPGRLGARKLAVDHCHATGVIRGLLCTPCNLGLGCFKDNPARLAGAISYLAAATPLRKVG